MPGRWPKPLVTHGPPSAIRRKPGWGATLGIVATTAKELGISIGENIKANGRFERMSDK
jgi:hypothetical protein